MTNQLPETLIIESGAIEVPAMMLYGVIAGSPDASASGGPYVFSTKGNKAKMRVCSALWRGYVATYRLRPDGMLLLEKLAYPLTPGAAPDEVHETLCGDFWLDFRESFYGDGVQVPFIDGKVVGDQSQWKRREGVDRTRFE